MDKLLLQDAEPYASAHRRKRRWYQVMTCLAAAVVFCTTYALILPAITLEKQCEIPEHTHTEACYTSVQGELICTQSTEPQHTHTEECYQETQDLVCGMSESTGHTHGAECYDQEGNLICGQEESEGHVHGEACCGVSRQLICGQTEEPAHQHTDACYSWNQVLTCDLEEHTHSEACTAPEPEEPEEPEEPVFCGKESHTHGESCRDEQGELTCTLEEHTHSLACYADPTADVETAEIWEQTFGDVTLTGDWRLDALAIARSQLGYAESTKNYAVAEDGQTPMGYTRYGAWKGDPYGGCLRPSACTTGALRISPQTKTAAAGPRRWQTRFYRPSPTRRLPENWCSLTGTETALRTGWPLWQRSRQERRARPPASPSLREMSITPFSSAPTL